MFIRILLASLFCICIVSGFEIIGYGFVKRGGGCTGGARTGFFESQGVQGGARTGFFESQGVQGGATT